MSSLVLSSRTGHCLFNTVNRFYFSLPSAIDFSNSRLNFYKFFHIHPFLFFAGLFPAFLLFFPAGRALSVFCNRSMAFFVISFKTLSPLFCKSFKACSAFFLLFSSDKTIAAAAAAAPITAPVTPLVNEPPIFLSSATYFTPFSLKKFTQKSCQNRHKSCHNLYFKLIFD